MRLRKHHLGQAANGHLELALLKSLLGAERAKRTNMRLFGVGMVFSPPLGLPHPDRTESLQSLAEPLVAHMRSRMPCLYQALDEADIVISNGGGTLHADLSGTVPVNHTSYDAPCPSGHVLPACPGKPVADLLLALWLAKTHFNKTVWLRNTMWHIDPQADAWARAFAPALRSLDSTLDSVETRGPSRAEELAAEAAWNAGEKAREFVSDPDVQDAAKTVAAGAAKAAAWGAKEGGKLAFRAATFAAKQAAKKDGK